MNAPAGLPSRATRRRARLVAVAFAPALALLLFSPAVAHEEPADEGRPASVTAQATEVGPGTGVGVRLDLAALDGVVQPDGALRLRLRVANAGAAEREGLRIVLTAHQRTSRRGQYQQAVDAGRVGAVVHALTIDVGPVPPRGARTVDVTQTAEQLGLARMQGFEGVYPLRLQLLDGDTVADELVTSFVALPSEVAVPLGVGLLLRLDHPPTRDAQGLFTDLSLPRALESEGRLGQVLAALDARGDAPLTVTVDAHTLEEVADLATGFRLAGDSDEHPADGASARSAADALERIREALAKPELEVLAAPYASADLVALVRGGLDAEASRHLTDGRRALENLVGRRPSEDGLVPVDGLDEPTLLQALEAGTRTVVLSTEQVALPAIRQETPSAHRRLRTATGTGVPAMVADPWLEQTVTVAHRSPALGAQRILGELATIYFELPFRPERGVLLPLPATPGVPGLAAAVADAVADADFLTPMTVSALRRRTAPEPAPVRLDYPPAARLRELPPSYVQRLEDARRALGSLDGVLVDDRATPARFDRVLLRAASSHYRPSTARDEGLALLDAVSSAVQRLYDGVVIPETPAVTLTGREGELPVTVRSSAEVPLRVRIELRTARLEIEGGPVRELILQPQRTEILTLPVRALNPGGIAPVEVRVTDVDGQVLLASGRVVVRSTGASFTAVLVMGGAALFLLVWSVGEVTRRRRDRGARDGTPHPGPGEGPLAGLGRRDRA